MKNLRATKRIVSIIAVLILGATAFSAAGQVTNTTGLANINQGTLPSEGEWIGGKVNATTVTVTLTGTVKMKGPIVIPKNKTLIITKNPDKPANSTYATIHMSRDFSVPSGSVHCMFEVQEGGKLIIEGNNLSNNFIAIKGNSGLETPTLPDTDSPTQEQIDAYLEKVASIYTTTTTPRDGHKFYADPTGHPNDFLYDFRGDATGTDEYRNAGAVIYVVGTLEMRHAKIACAFSRDDGAAIKRPVINYLPSDTEFGTVTLDNIQIRGCLAQSGPALIIFNQKNGSAGSGNTPSSCKTTISNSQIYRNYSRSNSVNGAVRTGGGVVGDLELTNVNIYQNYGSGYAAGLVAAGQGLEATTSELDGCKIHGNHSETYAGGILFTGSFLFTGSTTKVYNNTAGTYGGGVHVIAYNGVDFNEPKELSMEFNDKLEVYYNTAQWGGGMCFNMRNKTSLEPGSTINLDIDGVNVHENTATKKGGGIFLSYNNTGLNINLNINSGTIADNVADTSGGGLYCQVAAIDGETVAEDIDVSKCKVKLNGGTISGNTVTNGSGGGVAVYDMPIYCDDDAAGIEVFSNVALNYGAGIYVDNANFSMNSGSVYSNECTSTEEGKGEGGGIYCANGASFTITGGIVGGDAESDGNKSRNGAGIALADSKLIINRGVVASNVASNFGGGIHMENSEFEMTDGSVYRNSSTKSNGEGGGIYALESTLKIDGGLIGGNDLTYANKAFNGAGVFIQNCDLTMTNGRVSYNLSQRNAGGIYVKGTSTFSFEKGSICNNQNTDGEHDGHGAGIFVLSCNKFTIKDGEISGNHSANKGGGIYFCSDAKDVSISGGYIKDNHADSSHGGGIYVDGSNGVKVTGGVISGNNAVEGGGLYVNGGTITISGGDITSNTASRGAGIRLDAAAGLTLDGGYFAGNTSVYEGGALFLGGTSTCTFSNGAIGKTSSGEVLLNKASKGGGLYLDGGSLDMSGGEITSNEAAYGGGVYVYATPKLQFQKECLITNNKATSHGGGIYVADGTGISLTNGVISHNEAVQGGGLYAKGGEITISGGNINDNSALIGGAICNRGGALSFTGGSIINNVARCGGGIFLSDSGTQMTFGNGLIRNNKAVDGSGHTLTTGYGYDVSGGALALQGTGGGIYIQNGASMSFTSEDVGIYANSADTMADDIYSNGSNGASITLPDVSSMNLSGYNSRTSELYWVEDYMTDDTAYDSGTKIAGAGHKAVRYRDAIAAQSTVYKVPAGTYSGKYLALSIGYEVIYVTLQRTGLQAGESAIYRIFRIDNGVPSVYSEVLLTGSAGAPVQSKRVALYSGKWRVEETLWTWTYVPPVAIERDITGSTDAQNKVFSFTAAKNESVPEHAEDIVVNDFGEGAAVTGSYINSGSINDLQETTDYQLQ